MKTILLTLYDEKWMENLSSNYIIGEEISWGWAGWEGGVGQQEKACGVILTNLEYRIKVNELKHGKYSVGWLIFKASHLSLGRHSMSANIQKKIEDWKQRLIDLTRRNRLLFFKPTKSTSLFVIFPDISAIFNRLIIEEDSFRFWLSPETPTEQSQGNLDNTTSQQSQTPEVSERLPQINRDELRLKAELAFNNNNRREAVNYLRLAGFLPLEIEGILDRFVKNSSILNSIEAGLQPELVAFIQNNVKNLATIEAVDKLYADTDAAPDRYARAYARAFLRDDQKTNKNATNNNLPGVQKAGKIASKELVCDKSSKELEATLKNLYRRAKTDYQERGIRVLYIVFGLLNWKENSQSNIEDQAPLLLCPIEMKREKGGNNYEITLAEDDVVLNPALVVKLKNDFGLVLPPLPDDWEEISIVEYLNSINYCIKKYSPQWSVEHTVLLGLFSFHKMVMYQDLTENSARVAAHEMVNSLALGRSNSKFVDVEEGELDKLQHPENTYQILDADSSQRKCIYAALRGHNMVIQGPPGTGKSQTIANIIAEFLARGKTVLFVSEKMAALEVVHNRLRDNGLSDYCLELHSHKVDKKKVIEELNRCLNAASTMLQQVSLAASHDRLQQLRKQLNEYILALHEERKPLGESAYTVLGKLTCLKPAPFVSAKIKNVNKLTHSQIAEWRDLLKNIAPVWHVALAASQFPWYGCKDSHYSFETHQEWLSFLNEVSDCLGNLRLLSGRLASECGLNPPLEVEDIKFVCKVADLINKSPMPPKSWLGSANIDELVNISEKYSETSFYFFEIKNELTKRVVDSFFELSVEPAQIQASHHDVIQLATAAADPEGQWFFKLREPLRNFLNNDLAILKDCSAYGTAISEKLGLSHDEYSLNGLRELAQLAHLCAQELVIEEHWLTPTRIREVRELVTRTRPSYEDFSQRKEKLLQYYDEEFFTLDINQLIEDFSGFTHRTIVRMINPKFYKNRSAILRTSRLPLLRETVLHELIEARELLRLQKKLENDAQVKALFGNYYQGFDTDFSAIIKALNITEAIINATNSLPLPEQLVRILTRDSIEKSKLMQYSTALEAAIQKWYKAYALLSSSFGKQLLPENIHFENNSLFEIGNRLSLLSERFGILEKAVDAILPHYKQKPDNMVALIKDIEDGVRLKSIADEVETNKTLLMETFGPYYAGLETNWEEIESTLFWTKTIRDLFNGQTLPDGLIARIYSDGKLYVNPVKDALDAYLKLFSIYQARFSIPAPTSLVAVSSRFVFQKERIDDLQDWVTYRYFEEQIKSAGLSDFLDNLRLQSMPSESFVDILEKAIYQSWLDSIIHEDRRLGQFRGQNHEVMIREFQYLDRKLIQMAAARIVNFCDQRKQNIIGNASQDMATLTNASVFQQEMAFLRREGAKRNRRSPVRNLFERIPKSLFILKPCMLMSPLSVSQFLNAEKLVFDLVIFDEASQIFTEDGIGAIYRGKQVIVAGDKKQLPPTDFFKKLNQDDDYDDDAAEEANNFNFNSLLDECETITTSLKLDWHYRSKHESLIAYSNKGFYDSRLITFPSSSHQNEHLGIKFVHVADGIYDRGGKRDNSIEALKVADLVFEHFGRYGKKKSLGVIAFSQAQMNAIENEIERRLRTMPEFEGYIDNTRLEGFFVKNLENVQGDERDVIILSVGYGKDKHGELTNHFGPLNKAHGERRLNVAITRAKEKMTVVSSIRAADINLAGQPSAGLLHFYRYLDYVERGEAALELTNPWGKGEMESPLEVDVANAIRALGYDVVPQVGVSKYRIDLGVIDPAEPGRFLLGVECDGAMYHSAKTARDRDRLRQQVLEDLGWKIHRVWSTDWVFRKDTVLANLQNAILDAQPKIGSN